MFNMIRGFGHIYHRYLNKLSYIEALAAETAKGLDEAGDSGENSYVEKHVVVPDRITPIAEGDVCWYEENGDVLAVMYHPERINQIPSRAEMRRRVRCGEVIQLKEVLDKRFSHVPKVFELKKGVGSAQTALSHILDQLETHCSGEYWIDAFSPGLLQTVKQLSPSTPTSLHTRFGVYGPIVLKTAFETPPLFPKRLSSLPQVDAVSVTFKYSPVRVLRHFGYSIDEAHRWVYRAGKALILGGVESEQVARDAESSRVIAVYRKWK